MRGTGQEAGDNTADTDRSEATHKGPAPGAAIREQLHINNQHNAHQKPGPPAETLTADTDSSPAADSCMKYERRN